MFHEFKIPADSLLQQAIKKEVEMIHSVGTIICALVLLKLRGKKYLILIRSGFVGREIKIEREGDRYET